MAIFRDHQKSDREYFEVSLDKEGLPSYSIRGEFNKVAEGNILVYKHFEPRNKVLNYTFTYDVEKNMLEGIRTETNGNTIITFKLTYLKLFQRRINKRKSEDFARDRKYSSSRVKSILRGEECLTTVRHH